MKKKQRNQTGFAAGAGKRGRKACDRVNLCPPPLRQKQIRRKDGAPT